MRPSRRRRTKSPTVAATSHRLRRRGCDRRNRRRPREPASAAGRARVRRPPARHTAAGGTTRPPHLGRVRTVLGERSERRPRARAGAQQVADSEPRQRRRIGLLSARSGAPPGHPNAGPGASSVRRIVVGRAGPSRVADRGPRAARASDRRARARRDSCRLRRRANQNGGGRSARERSAREYDCSGRGRAQR